MDKQETKKPKKEKRDRSQVNVDRIDGRVWGHRLRTARDARTKAMEEGSAIRAMISGRATKELQAEMKMESEEWVLADWNKMAALVRVMIPALLHNEPDVTVEPWDELDEDSVRKAELYTYLCRRFIRGNARMENSKAALFEAIVYGKGCTFTDFNKAEMQPRTRFQTIREVYIDPQYDGTPNTLQWVARDLVLSVEEAKKKWPKKARYFKPTLSDMSKEEADRVNADEALSEKHINHNVRLVEVWINGSSTEFPDLPLGQEGVADDKEEGHHDHTGYHGKNEVLTLILNEKGIGTVINRAPWPWTLNEGEFPFSFLELTNDPNRTYGQSILSPARRLQDIMNIMFSALTTRQVQSSKDIISFVGEDFENPDEVEKQLRGDSQLIVARMKSGKRIKEALSQTSIGTPNAAQAALMDTANSAFEDTTGYRELTTGDVRKAQSATAAQFSEERRQSSIANAVLSTERWQGNISRKELMLAQSVMTADDIAEIAPARLLGEPKPQKDNDGNTIMLYPYWDDNMTPRSIRNESQCFVRAGSMRFMSVEERRDAMVEMLRVYQESLAMVTNSGFEVPKEAVAAIFKMANHIARLAGVPEFKDLQIDPEILQPIEDESAKQEEIAQQSQQAQQQMAQALPQMIQQVVAPLFSQFGEALMTKIIEAMQLQSAQPMQPQQPVNPLASLGL
jgi:hypothetical protein